MPFASDRRSPVRKACFSGAALLLTFVGLESVLRVAHYQWRGERPLAAVEGFDWLRQRYGEWRRAEIVADVAGQMEIYRALRKAIDRVEGAELRAELEDRYAARFTELAAAVSDGGSRFLVVDFLMGRDHVHGRFVADLAARCGADHIDLAAVLRDVPVEHKQLVPADYHLTRYANQLVAAAVAARLDEYRGHRSGLTYAGSPVVLGDCFLRYGGDQRRLVLNIDPELAFCLVRNAHGFRMAEDLEVPKRRQRVLCLGDSFTFGDHLDNQDTFPAIVGRLRPELEVLNAGIGGYTITDQLALFLERARLAAPDVTMLQVCDNDLVELTAFSQNFLGRQRSNSAVPSDAERHLLATLR